MNNEPVCRAQEDAPDRPNSRVESAVDRLLDAMALYGDDRAAVRIELLKTCGDRM